MITKEEILRLATGMAGRIFASDSHGDASIEEVVQDCFNSILHIANKYNIRIEDGPARRDSIYTPEVEAALARSVAPRPTMKNPGHRSDER